VTQTPPLISIIPPADIQIHYLEQFIPSIMGHGRTNLENLPVSDSSIDSDKVLLQPMDFMPLNANQ
jgi:hypothetical protein